MAEGFGADWTEWDKFLEEKFPKPQGIRYQNWQPFLSPKGQWMAFCGMSYADIRIVKLPSMEVVVDRFYTNSEEKVYASHANYATYVPSYVDAPLERKGAKLPDGYRFTTVDYGGVDKETVEAEGAILASIPLAFNAWTIWAADYEFYVDIIDLRQVDDGIIKLSGAPSFVITRDASHVRNYVKADISHWHSIETKSQVPAVYASFEYMVKEERDRFYSDKNLFADMNQQDGTGYLPENELPWQTLQKRMNERKKS